MTEQAHIRASWAAVVAMAFCGISPASTRPAPPLPPPTGNVIRVNSVSALQDAVRNLASDTTIMIEPGMYPLTHTLHIIGPVTQVALRGSTGNRGDVVIRGLGMENPNYGDVPHCVLVSNARNVLIADLTLGDVAQHPIILNAIDGCDDVQIYNCRLFDAGQQFVKSSLGNPANRGVDRGIVEYCLLEYKVVGPQDDGYTNGVDVLAGDDWIIRYNVFRNIHVLPGLPYQFVPAVLMWRGCRNTVCEANSFIDCDRAIAFGLTDQWDDGVAEHDHEGGVIRNNFIHTRGDITNADAGVIVWDSPGTKVYHNTVLLNGVYPNAIEYRFAGTTGVEIKNNLTDARIAQRDGATAILAGNVTNATAAMFRDASSGDLHLKGTATSAIDRGVALPECGEDWDGQQRPFAKGWDVGADEHRPDVRGNCGAIATFEDGRTPARELFVSLQGMDAPGGGAADRPLRTIAYAASLATPGTAVRVQPGTYAGGIYLDNLAGTADAPIWIGGEPGQPRPVIQGSGEGLHLTRARYVIVHDLEVRDAANNGINCDDGGDYGDPLATHHVIFRNLSIHDIGGTGNQDGLKLSGLNDYLVLDCEMARCGGSGSGSGIDHVGCHRGLIARCYLHDLSANAVQCKGGSEDIEIRWCRIREAGERGVNIGGSTGFEFFRPPLSTDSPNAEARNIHVVSNVIEGCTASLAFVGCVDSLAANNTIVIPHNWILRILQETVSSGSYTFLPCGNDLFVNNLVYFDRSDLSTYVNIGPNTTPATFTFSNNLWYARDNPGASTPNLPVTESAGIYGRDPLLADPAAGDYRIGGDSPAAGAGLPPAQTTGDIRGVCWHDPPSIGAYEHPWSGDLNCDGTLDGRDVAAFVIAVASPSVYAATYPACDRDAADCNEDGMVDRTDIAFFVGLLSNP